MKTHILQGKFSKLTVFSTKCYTHVISLNQEIKNCVNVIAIRELLYTLQKRGENEELICLAVETISV